MINKKDFSDFISKEALSGLLLLVSAILALIASNSFLEPYYHYFLDIIFSVSFNNTGISKPLVLWINDGLMAVFFLLIGLELKREFLTGELREYDKLILPLAGALGGILVPTAIFYLFTMGDPNLTKGWAIPMATDIAFALGVLALFSKRVPISLKVFLLTLAIIDDIGAILVIALFHTADLSVVALLAGSGCIFILILLNYFRVYSLSPYIIVGAVLWVFILKSGFHATIAGIVLAMTIPMEDGKGKLILPKLEHDLHFTVAFFILPIFAFANAGVPLQGMQLSDFFHPIILGIVFGLVLGKSIGIILFTLLAKRIFNIPSSFTCKQLFAVSLLCGIGFTMSLFIAGLSYSDEALLNYSRLGILLGSLFAIIIGITMLQLSLPKSNQLSKNE